MGGKGLPVTHRVQVPGLGPRGRGDSIENTVAFGVGQRATGEIGELVEVVVFVEIAQGRIDEIGFEQAIADRVGSQSQE